MLHTARLRLRPPQRGDELAAHAGWAQDADVLRYLGWRARTDLTETRAQLDWDQARWHKGSAWTWLLIGASEGKPIGLVQLTPQRLDAPAHHLRLGFLLARAHWGRGLMKEALTAVLDEAFAQPAVWRVDALCDVDNHASARLLRALNFAEEGVLARHSLHPNISAEPRDAISFARLR
jgi:[ribosomal protein S5]-alanine N-acetyltransferase